MFSDNVIEKLQTPPNWVAQSRQRICKGALRTHFLTKFSMLRNKHMPTNTDVFERFARVVNTFNFDSPKDSADQFAELTCNHSK